MMHNAHQAISSRTAVEFVHNVTPFLDIQIAVAISGSIIRKQQPKDNWTNPGGKIRL
jgi:nicotinamide mononucleotide (NMN) deamidase PncC